jgi:glycosyltransferase involved in cell wall biosynthesis
MGGLPNAGPARRPSLHPARCIWHDGRRPPSSARGPRGVRPAALSANEVQWSRMRFCMVTTFYPPRHFGGDAIYVQALARALTRAGHAVEVVVAADAFRAAGGDDAMAAGADDGAADGSDGVVVHRLRSRFGRAAALFAHQTGAPGPLRGALAALLGRGFDVIHYHNISLIGGPAVLALGRAKAKLWTLHDHWLVCPTHVLWKNGERACDAPTCLRCSLRSGRPPQLWRYGGAIARALAHVDVLFAPSAWSAARHRAGGIARPIELLPHFSRFDVAATVAPPAAPPRFLFVGRITAAKGVRALAELFAARPHLALTIAGDGELRAPLAAAFAHCANIRFAGTVHRAELAALYATATATIVPSLAPESFGLVAVESMGFGTPVLALDAGGCGELVRESGGGIVATDIAGLGRAVDLLAIDAERRAALGHAGRAAVAAGYTEAGHLARYLGRVQALAAAH